MWATKKTLWATNFWKHGQHENMCGQHENVCGQPNFGSRVPSGNFNFRNSYIPD